MTISRRTLLQYTTMGCTLVALPAMAGTTTSLRAYRVQDTVALPRFRVDDMVVADTGVARFTGPGFYLYPDWGQPRLYEVRASAGGLEFRNPGSGLLLWTQSADMSPAFAGRVVDQPATLLAGLPHIAVPQLPATA